MYSKQRGNILFLILLAVILFAALSYAVIGNERGQVKSAAGENSEAKAAELSNYFIQIDTAVQRMMLTGGIKDYEINFYYAFASNYVIGSNDNTNCTASACRVFDPAGGGVSGRKTTAFATDVVNSSNLRVFYISVPGVGTSFPDVVLAQYTTPLGICEALNKKIGQSGIIFNVPAPNETNALMYFFSIPIGPIPSVTQTLSGISPQVGSQGTFCTCSGSDLTACLASSWMPITYHVVLAR